MISERGVISAKLEADGQIPYVFPFWPEVKGGKTACHELEKEASYREVFEVSRVILNREVSPELAKFTSKAIATL